MEKIKIVEINEKGQDCIALFNTTITNFREVSKAIKGKYLFYSEDKEKLIGVAKIILKEFRLLLAKVPLPPIGKDFVLCIYDKEPRFKNKLRLYADEVDIRYRYWKSNDDTRKGKYSKEFLDNLPLKERKKWVRDEIQ